MRAARLTLLPVLLVILLAAACGGDAAVAPAGSTPTPNEPTTETSASTTPDAPIPAPSRNAGLNAGLDLALTWQWQLQGDLNTSYDVDLYDVDLFDTATAQIAALHQDGRTVLCYFSAGSGENWRPDYGRIPASALGEPLDGWEGERWLDIRAPSAANTGVRAVLLARLDLAAERGCDGVEPDNVTAWENDSGFPIGEADQVEFNRWLAAAAHDRGLFIALKNAGPIAPQLVDAFDLALNEECHAFNECEEFQPFLNAGKPILNVEYSADEASARSLATDVCPRAAELGLRTLILPLALDDAFRLSCN